MGGAQTAYDFYTGGEATVGVRYGGGALAATLMTYDSRAVVSTTRIRTEVRHLRTAGYSGIGPGGGLYQKVDSEPAHAGKVQSADGAWWELVSDPGGVCIEQFGGVGDGLTDNSAAMTSAIAYCVAKGVGTLRFGDGDFVFSSQVHITAGAGVVLRLNIRGNGIVNTTVKLNVTGSVAGYDVAGFGWVFDGWSSSSVTDMRIDASGGTACIAVQCRNQSVYYAQFGPNLEIRGGTALADRETATNIGVRMIGNRSGDVTSYGILYNHFIRVRFTTCYKLVEHIVADGDPTTRFPNQCQFIGCNYDRYIIGLDLGESDEHNIIGAFFNNAAGVTGINGGFTHCIVTNGSLHQVWMGGEPGSNSKPFSIGADCESNHFFILSNCTHAGDYAAAVRTNTVFDRDRIIDLSTVNNIDSDTDDAGSLHFFGDGTNSHQGTGFFRLYLWGRDGNTDRMGLGYTATNTATIDLPSGDTLVLDVDALLANGATIRFTNLPVYADEAAALAGGLAQHALYKTSGGEVRVKL